MPLFTIVIRNREGSPIEGEASGPTVDHAIKLAQKMGHDVDEEATRKLAAEGMNTAGKAASVVGFLIALPAVLFPYCALASIVLGVMGVEASKGRRGWPAVAAGVILGGLGMLVRLRGSGFLD
ncbi:MAG TPA: hypothetical protein VD997_12505 [Phycisphaerales bacterium]|nr:hypothetical protein [Phycisphaerales bacterium]